MFHFMNDKAENQNFIFMVMGNFGTPCMLCLSVVSCRLSPAGRSVTLPLIGSSHQFMLSHWLLLTTSQPFAWLTRPRTDTTGLTADRSRTQQAGASYTVILSLIHTHTLPIYFYCTFAVSNLKLFIRIIRNRTKIIFHFDHLPCKGAATTPVLNTRDRVEYC